MLTQPLLEAPSFPPKFTLLAKLAIPAKLTYFSSCPPTHVYIQGLRSKANTFSFLAHGTRFE